MKRIIHYTIIIACIIATLFLYNDGKGAIPFLILAIYFLILGFIEVHKLKNNKSN